MFFKIAILPILKNDISLIIRRLWETVSAKVNFRQDLAQKKKGAPGCGAPFFRYVII